MLVHWLASSYQTQPKCDPWEKKMEKEKHSKIPQGMGFQEKLSDQLTGKACNRSKECLP